MTNSWQKFDRYKEAFYRQKAEYNQDGTFHADMCWCDDCKAVFEWFSTPWPVRYWVAFWSYLKEKKAS